MTTIVGTRSSLQDINQAFLDAPAPTLDTPVGEHEGESIGPLWLRAPAPLTLALTGMAGWCGKSFQSPEAGAEEIAGTNLVRRKGQTLPSIPMTARIGPSRLDGKPAIIVSYPKDARFPWRRATDELRALDDKTLLGLTWGIPGAPKSGTPFVLRRCVGSAT